MKLHNLIRNHPQFKDYHQPIMDLIEDGLVRLNGKRRRTNRNVIVGRDVVEVCLEGQWQVLDIAPERTVMLMYKPRGYLCSHYDPYWRPVIYDLIDDSYADLNSAGRLDQDSEGLLILTDDGQYLFKLINPIYECQKKYLVGLKQALSDEFITEAESGKFTINLDSDVQTLRPVLVTPITQALLQEFNYLGLENDIIWYEFTLTEGKYNQIRRMCAKYENPVQRLIRIQHGEHRLNQELYNQGWLITQDRISSETKIA
ncbi:MAG: pseudouridine synthase [Patescibacteria group bacterium]